jgi:hypothetical protein
MRPQKIGKHIRPFCVYTNLMSLSISIVINKTVIVWIENDTHTFWQTIIDDCLHLSNSYRTERRIRYKISTWQIKLQANNAKALRCVIVKLTCVRIDVVTAACFSRAWTKFSFRQIRTFLIINQRRNWVWYWVWHIIFYIIKSAVTIFIHKFAFIRLLYHFSKEFQLNIPAKIYYWPCWRELTIRFKQRSLRNKFNIICLLIVLMMRKKTICKRRESFLALYNPIIDFFSRMRNKYTCSCSSFMFEE